MTLWASAADLLFAARIALSSQPWLCLGGPNSTETARNRLYYLTPFTGVKGAGKTEQVSPRERTVRLTARDREKP
jgi:hypothetical protein